MYVKLSSEKIEKQYEEMGNFKREMEARKMKPIKMIYTKNVISEMDTQRKPTIKMKSSYENNSR